MFTDIPLHLAIRTMQNNHLFQSEIRIQSLSGCNRKIQRIPSRSYSLHLVKITYMYTSNYSFSLKKYQNTRNFVNPTATGSGNATHPGMTAFGKIFSVLNTNAQIYAIWDIVNISLWWISIEWYILKFEKNILTKVQ